MRSASWFFLVGGLDEMATKSDQIRALAQSGTSVSEIARKLGIRYQHAYNVCRAAGLIGSSSAAAPKASLRALKPRLSVQRILQGGFTTAGAWVLSNGKIQCSNPLPDECGVYAFSVAGEVVYVGVASRSLLKRIYPYSRPGPSQRTNIRLNSLIRQSIIDGETVDVHFACPPQHSWNGFTIRGAEGLEAGLIAEYLLPWNVRGA